MQKIKLLCKQLILSLFIIVYRFTGKKDMLHQQGLDIYCTNCNQSVKHKESTDNRWFCVNCDAITRLQDYSRYTQLFQEVKIDSIIQSESPKVFTTYHRCQLNIIDVSNESRIVWLSEHPFIIHLNANAAKFIPNNELKRLFHAALNAVIFYRIKH